MIAEFFENKCSRYSAITLAEEARFIMSYIWTLYISVYCTSYWTKYVWQKVGLVKISELTNDNP